MPDQLQVGLFGCAEWQGKWGYVYGNIDPENMIADLQELATKYAETDDGIVPWRERPESLRRNVIARIPPLD